MPDDFTPDLNATSRSPTDRGVAALFADLIHQAGLLIRQEIALLGAELDEKLRRVGQGTTALAVGAALAISGWFVLLAAAVLGLALVVPGWLAALIVGGIVLAVGGVILYVGKRRLAARALVPRRTLRSLREDESWIKDHIR